MGLVGMATIVSTRMLKSQTMRLSVLLSPLKDGATRARLVKNAMHGNAESIAKKAYAVEGQSADWRMY